LTVQNNVAEHELVGTAILRPEQNRQTKTKKSFSHKHQNGKARAKENK
jgi:hypothetical protein